VTPRIASFTSDPTFLVVIRGLASGFTVAFSRDAKGGERPRISKKKQFHSGKAKYEAFFIRMHVTRFVWRKLCILDLTRSESPLTYSYSQRDHPGWSAARSRDKRAERCTIEEPRIDFHFATWSAAQRRCSKEQLLSFNRRGAGGGSIQEISNGEWMTDTSGYYYVVRREARDRANNVIIFALWRSALLPRLGKRNSTVCAHEPANLAAARNFTHALITQTAGELAGRRCRAAPSIENRSTSFYFEPRHGVAFLPSGFSLSIFRSPPRARPCSLPA